MSRSQILEELSQIVRELAGDDSIVLSEETVADDVEAWDSAFHVKVMTALIAAYDIQFTTWEITAPENVGELIDLIESKLCARSRR